MADKNLVSRTDAKLRYVELHLEELRACRKTGRGNDFERSHQEAFFFQLFGVHAALLQELNEDLGCGLQPNGVSLGKMRNAMLAHGPVSTKLTDLHNLEQNSASWFAQAKRMRDHITHIAGIPLVFYEGGPNDGMTALRNPSDLSELPGDYIDSFSLWLAEMKSLVQRLR